MNRSKTLADSATKSVVKAVTGVGYFADAFSLSGEFAAVHMEGYVFDARANQANKRLSAELDRAILADDLAEQLKLHKARSK